MPNLTTGQSRYRKRSTKTEIGIKPIAMNLCCDLFLIVFSLNVKF